MKAAFWIIHASDPNASTIFCAKQPHPPPHVRWSKPVHFWVHSWGWVSKCPQEGEKSNLNFRFSGKKMDHIIIMSITIKYKTSLSHSHPLNFLLLWMPPKPQVQIPPAWRRLVLMQKPEPVDDRWGRLCHGEVQLGGDERTKTCIEFAKMHPAQWGTADKDSKAFWEPRHVTCRILYCSQIFVLPRLHFWLSILRFQPCTVIYNKEDRPESRVWKFLLWLDLLLN